MVFVLWGGRRSGPRLGLVPYKHAASSKSPRCAPSRNSLFLSPSRCCLVSRPKWLNWVEGVHRFYVVFSDLSFSLRISRSSIISLFLSPPFFPLLLKSLICKSNFRFPWKYYVNLEEYGNSGYLGTKSVFLTIVRCNLLHEICLFQCKNIQNVFIFLC